MRRGYKTTEFWLALIAALLPVIKKYLCPDLPHEALYAIIAYIVGRSWVKSQRDTDE